MVKVNATARKTLGTTASPDVISMYTTIISFVSSSQGAAVSAAQL